MKRAWLACVAALGALACNHTSTTDAPADAGAPVEAGPKKIPNGVSATFSAAIGANASTEPLTTFDNAGGTWASAATGGIFHLSAEVGDRTASRLVAITFYAKPTPGMRLTIEPRSAQSVPDSVAPNVAFVRYSERFGTEERAWDAQSGTLSVVAVAGAVISFDVPDLPMARGSDDVSPGPDNRATGTFTMSVSGGAVTITGL